MAVMSDAIALLGTDAEHAILTAFEFESVPVPRVQSEWFENSLFFFFF